MDKKLTRDVRSVKQWRSLCKTVSLALEACLRLLLTGGVPKRPPAMSMYHIDNRFVAIDMPTSIELTICQKAIFSIAFT
jgi:hypothetical protein